MNYDPTFTLNDSCLEWSFEEHGWGAEVRRPVREPLDACDYRTILDPDDPNCR